MSSVFVTWQEIVDPKEKYAAYLCSPEWSFKREQVRSRSGGVCERCGVNPMDAVHHLNYLRKYNEELTDLIAICNDCHEFTHGKSHYDPRRHAGLVVCGKRIRSVYLAGKITKDNWRQAIIGRFSESFECKGVELKYLGPMPLLEHEHGSVPGIHGQFEYDDDWNHGAALVANCHDVLGTCSQAIKFADLMFAWIGTSDCYGTIAEIGLRCGFGYQGATRLTAIAFSVDLDESEFWFVRTMADVVIRAKTAREAWSGLIDGKAWVVPDQEVIELH